ncbi:acetyltransferase [Holosporaceae bacterium 'Namur']|nr:acetyltransferase [Holosporaceae bacterium 'Namur']
MNISFKPLNKKHFGLLLKWLNTPHVRKWWDTDIIWTKHSIEEKYHTYVKGFKLTNSKEKPIYPYIITIDDKEVGYIQYYNAYDFPREGYIISGMPESLASIDIFIGEVEFVGKGLGVGLVAKFLDEYVFSQFESIFIDPDINNKAAIHAYEKAGFKAVKQEIDLSVIWMIKKRNNV